MKRLTDEQRQLVEANMGIARTVAIRLHRSGGIYTRIDLETAISAAYEGLAEAATAFDPARGVKFSSFAGWRCLSCIQNAVLQAGAITLPAQARIPLREAGPNVRRDISAAWACGEAVAAIPKGESPSCHVPIVAPSPCPTEAAESKAKQVRWVRTILGPLDEQSKRIVRMHAIGGMLHGEIAKRLGIQSAKKCSVIYHEAIEKLRGVNGVAV